MNPNEILKERAKNLAKPTEQKAIKGDYLEVLIFKIANEKYGIETKYTREVHPLKDYTSLPCSPSYIFGLINVRRKILAVIDLKVLFGLPKYSNEEKKVIILKDSEREFGILSDGFEGIIKIPLNKIQPSLPTLIGIRQELTKGISSDGVVILDGQKLIASKKIICEEMVEI